ncbi:alpha/beta hydrolase [Nocardioides guangzhouensis]|uniref:Alpha/beta hydrolase n=1 Tax=Nocardioides guangzhouensis TaxID=2497878 RepID=A0A4V1XZV5_9ACTN|nr:alpha/beta hydrolase [Nocardioides guangzhouensis]RYP88069.1 alpha/beta hydrolase [Nocardioides guangzhouensis]
MKGTAVYRVEHGDGRPVLVLHGAGVDHREAEACFEPALGAREGYRRIYPDLPGTGRTPAPESVRSADDVLSVLLDLAAEVAPTERLLVVGHSAGAYYAQGMAARRPDRVAGLALVCPLLAGVRDVPGHHPVVAAEDLGDQEFRDYFVVQTPAMLERYERFVAPGAALADQAAMARIGERWELAPAEGPPYEGPTLVVAGRLDSVVGHAAAEDLLDHYPRCTLAVLDGAGHALPHEQPQLLAALLDDWMRRSETPAGQTGVLVTRSTRSEDPGGTANGHARGPS